MFRCILSSAARAASFHAPKSFLVASGAKPFQVQKFSSLLNNNNYINSMPSCVVSKAGIQNPSMTTKPILLESVLPLYQQQSTRTVTKFSLKKGKRKTVKAVIKRFKRLHWGAWIRTYTGRNKKMFKKSAARKRRLRQHVITNSTQSMLLDKMVTNFWRKPKYYVDDPYEPYHERNEFFATKAKKFKV